MNKPLPSFTAAAFARYKMMGYPPKEAKEMAIKDTEWWRSEIAKAILGVTHGK